MPEDHVKTSETASLSLDSRIDIARVVIGDALRQFRRPAVVWSVGKDSTTVLHLTKELVEARSEVLPPCIFIDHGDHFDETMNLMNEIKGAWKLKIVVAKNEDVLEHIGPDGKIIIADLSERNREEVRRVGFEGESFEYSLDNIVGNHLLKTVPMNDLLLKYRFDALFTGIRWDENPARAGERFITQRDNPYHARVQPILPFTERNIWDYIFRFKLPYHPLYKVGYRSIDGKMDSSKSSDLPAWEQDVEHTRERAGRAQDKEEKMAKLRQLGYM